MAVDVAVDAAAGQLRADDIDNLVDALVAELGATWTTADALGAQFDRGLAWVHAPLGLGGVGAAPSLQSHASSRLVGAGLPDPFDVNPLGYGMCGPAVIGWGTPQQQQRHLRPLFTGEEVWCQLFSEPGAGSDIAGLATLARPDGDEWVVNGQKVWTTMGHRARWGLLLARTDPEAVKHAGITAFILDMASPGVEVRPLYQMTGEAEFNEVFLDDVRIPAEAVLGTVGGGWKVAVTTLMNERVAIGGGVAARGSGVIADLLAVWLPLADSERGRAFGDVVARLWVRAEILRLTNVRFGQLRGPGDPGPEGSISKISAAELNKDVYNTVMNLIGAQGLLYPGGYTMSRPDQAVHEQSMQQSFLRSRANSIEGGTTEVMRNILAERMLGLPADIRVDRDRPWRDIPRN